jgi:hypothetical protein
MPTGIARKQCPCHCHSSSSNSEGPVETVASIDDEIQRAKDRIHALRRRRNALLPVARLPAEIMCRIFEDYKRSSLLPYQTYGVLYLTQVCSTWYSTARSCPSLWTVIDFRCPKLATASALLAKSFPLSISYDDESGPSLSSVLNLLPRSRSLNISSSGKRWSKASKKFATSPVPYLQGLFVDLYECSGVEEAIYIPSIDAAPKLTCVSLSKCVVSWESFQGCRLRALDISSPLQRPTLATFRSVLASQEQLELLSLTSSLPLFTTENSSTITETPVQLKNLLLLRIADEGNSINMFLHHFTIAPHTKISIMVYESSLHSGFHQCVENTANQFKNIDALPWLSVFADYGTRSYILYVYSDETFKEPPLLSIITEGPKTGDAVRATGTILRVFSERVRLISLHGTVVDKGTMNLNPLPHVHTVETRDYATIDVIEFLQDSSTFGDQLVWPSLSTLDLGGLEIGNYRISTHHLHVLEDELRRRERITGRRLASLRIDERDVGKIASNVAELINSHSSQSNKKHPSTELEGKLKRECEDFMKRLADRG